MKFYNREKEIRALSNIKGSFRIAVVGRRRIGKTRLVEEFYKNRILTLFVSAEKSEKEIIGDWSAEYNEVPKVSALKDAFEYMFSQQTDRIIFIDELQNVMKVNKSFIFDLQRLLDKYKPKLVVSGSLISVMKKLVESYKSPLFGRFDMVFKLNELEFGTVANICRDMGMDFEAAIKLYSVFGGVPKYYELIEKTSRFNFEDFVLDMFVNYPRPLYEEVRTMLKEEFGKEHRMLFSIVSAISQGNTKLSEIAGFVGTESTKITKYVDLLKNDFEIIGRETPLVNGKMIDAQRLRKRGIYTISSNLVRFWFANIWKHQELLEKREEEKLAESLKKNLNAWHGKIFEKIVLDAIKCGKINMPFSITDIGRQWGKLKSGSESKVYEIDIMALGNESVLFAECKWKNNVDAEKALAQLKEKSLHVNIHGKKEYFAVFAKSFSRKAQEKNTYCFDLKDLEQCFIK